MNDNKNYDNDEIVYLQMSKHIGSHTYTSTIKHTVTVLGSNSTWLDSTRLDSTRHIRRVEPMHLVVSS